MFYVKQSESTAARRRVPILMVDETDGSTPETGLTLYGLLSKNGNTFAATAGTFAEAGYGQYYYQFDTGEIDTLGFAGIHVTATGARNYDAIIHVTAYDAYVGSFIAPTDVWNADISSITTAGTAGSQLNTAALGGAGGGITAGDVWDYDIVTNPLIANSASEKLLEARYYADLAQGNTSDIGGVVWTYDPQYGGPIPAAGGYLIQAGDATTTIASDVWNYDISAVSGAGLAGTQLNLAASAIGITAGDVWSYATREITGGTATTVTNAVLVDPASMSGIAGTVWNTDVSAFLTPSAGYDLTQAASGGAGITAGDVTNAVWDVATSSYTTSGTFGHNILRSDVAGTAGTVSLWTGLTLSGIYADTYRIDDSYDAATALKDILTGIGASITGNITGDLSGSVGSVTADVNVSTASMSGIANTVWSTDISGYTSPSAGYDLTQAASGGAGITAGDVWNYVIDTGDSANTTLSNVYANTNANGILGSVWGADPLDFDPGTSGALLSQAASGAGITAGDVWEYDISAISTAGSAGTQLNVAAAGGGAGITAGAVADAVWTAQVATYATAGSNETLGTDTYGQKIARTVNINRPISINTANGVVVGSMSNGAITATAIASNAITEAKFATDALTSRVIAADAITSAELAPSANTEIADAVWATVARTITGGTITTNNDKTGYSLSSTQTFDLTGNITGDLSGSVGSVATGVTVIANNDKTGYSLSSTQSFNLTGNITGNLSGSVGSVSGAVSSVTNPITVSTGSMTGIAGTVWSVATRTITGGTATTVTNAVLVDPASMVGIAGTVWNTDVTSYTNPSAGYSLAVAGSGGVSAADVWQYPTRDITGGALSSPVDLSVQANANVAEAVWTRDLGGGSKDAEEWVVEARNAAVAAQEQTGTSTIRDAVWDTDVSYLYPSIQAGGALYAAAFGATSAGSQVWNYNISGIATTGTAGAVLNDVAIAGNLVTIVNGPYRLTSIAEGTDGRIDILADSVQTIQLNCLDGFGQPFNITGYSCLVNVYDISGALAVTYTPTVDFASSGILSFDIDTDVTGVSSTYTLVVELTAGAEVVQLGPLQILVRPL
jgi:hypothetical protein